VVLNLTVCQAFNVSDAGAAVPSGRRGPEAGVGVVDVAP